MKIKVIEEAHDRDWETLLYKYNVPFLNVTYNIFEIL